MATELQVSVAHRLYECRRLMRSALGSRYGEIIDGYTKSIRQVAKERNLGEIQTALEMAKEMDAIHSDQIIPVCLMAAAVEMIEPTPDPTSGSNNADQG